MFTNTLRTHSDTHTPRLFCEKWGHPIRRNGFYTVQTVCAIAPTPNPTLNLALTGDCAFLLSPPK